MSPIRVIDHEGKQLGVISTDDAIRMARDAGLDLVEVQPNVRPPVCKIMDYGKHKYELSKRQKHSHHEQKVKEIRLRPRTDLHDKQTKIKHAREFLEHGDRVQFTMKYRGRERMHRDLGLEALNEIAVQLADLAKVDQAPRMFGPRMTMVLVPLKTAPAKVASTQPSGGAPRDRAAPSAAAPGASAAVPSPQAVAAPASQP